jgi:hypothetical protein
MNDENMRIFTIFSRNLTDLTHLAADESLSREKLAEISLAVGYLQGHPGYGDEEILVIEAIMESGQSLGMAIEILEPVIRKRTVL